MGNAEHSNSTTESRSSSRKSRKTPVYLQSSVLLPVVSGIVVLAVIAVIGLVKGKGDTAEERMGETVEPSEAVVAQDASTLVEEEVASEEVAPEVPEVVTEPVANTEGGVPLATIDDVVVAFAPTVETSDNPDTPESSETPETEVEIAPGVSPLASKRKNADKSLNEEGGVEGNGSTESPTSIVLASNPRVEERLESVELGASIGEGTGDLLAAKQKPKIDFEEGSRLVERLVEASSVGDLLPIIHQPDRVRPLLHEYYARPGKRVDDYQGAESVNFHLVEIDGLSTLVAGVGKKDYTRTVAQLFLIEGQLKIDWEALVQYDPIPWEKFLAREVSELSSYRVMVRADDFYNGIYANSEEYLCLRLSKLNEEGFLYGYLKRESPEGIKFEQKLGVQAVAMTLLLGRNEEAGRLQCDVVGIVAESWRDKTLN
jgi:hypothetical protein